MGKVLLKFPKQKVVRQVFQSLLIRNPNEKLRKATVLQVTEKRRNSQLGARLPEVRRDTLHRTARGALVPGSGSRG